MYDYEFFRKWRQSPAQRPVLYVYKSGIRRKEMSAVLRERVATPIETVSEGNIRSVLSGRNLFGGQTLYIVDLSQSWDDELLGILVAEVARPDHDIAGIFVRETVRQFRRAGWREVERASIHVREPRVTATNLKQILRSLQETTDLAESPELVSQPGFVSSFGRFVADGSSLAELKNAFDVALCSLDPATNEFVDPAPDQLKSVAPPSFKTVATNFLMEQNERTKAALTGAVDEALSAGATAQSVYARLFRASASLLAELVDQKRASRKSTAIVQPLDGVLWGALLLAQYGSLAAAIGSGARTKGPKPGTIVAEGLAADFLRRVSTTAPLHGMWPPLMSSVAGIRTEQLWLPKTGMRLVLALADLLNTFGEAASPAWMQRLKNVLDTPEAGNELVLPRPTPLATSMTKLQDLLGNAAAIAAVKYRVRMDRHAMPLIIHGANGVGKRTLALLYAKARLCDAPISDDACGICDACKLFDEGRSLNVAGPYQVADDAEATLQELTRQRSSSLAPRRSVILTGVDNCPPEVFDVLLKTLENPPAVTFILTADDLKNVRIAGQSRAQAIAMKPLVPDDARAFFARHLSGHATEDVRLLDLLGAAAGGLPGRLYQMCAAIEEAGISEATDIRRLFSLDWITEAQALIKKVAGQYDPHAVAFVGDELCQTDWQRFRTILAQLFLWRRSGVGAVSMDEIFSDLSSSDRAEMLLDFRRHFASTENAGENWRGVIESTLRRD
ncbi:hypothetical protein [Mesorhizobium sp. L2C067A000]|uniref:hypothetical protein n=1 Tax=Mesorhizobium sp. L2C067A000 TaxID=1287106 RepID=UPI0003F4F435|nr:hypothetical protein [Mesorhizobium sp. L2C067A000]